MKSLIKSKIVQILSNCSNPRNLQKPHRYDVENQNPFSEHTLLHLNSQKAGMKKKDLGGGGGSSLPLSFLIPRIKGEKTERDWAGIESKSVD